MQNTFKVSCIQNNAGENIRQNIDNITQLLIEAHSEGADLICLPEYFCYVDNDDNRMLAHSYYEEEHPALPHFYKLAEQLNVWLHLGSLPIKIDDNKVNNRSYLINNQGTVEARYNKIHLFDVNLSEGESYLESATVEAGDKPVLASTPWGRLGMSICYDLRFAYLYRQLAQSGANFLAIPAAFTKTTGMAHWHTLVRARAIETGCYVFAPCQCGTHPGKRTTYGHSLIVDPWGTVLVDAGEKPGYIIADVDVQQVLLARQKIPALKHDRQI
ncbi:MAG: carbon-nitrogen hydrolase family protein [Gammaproteobacteria bacterium]|nr:carbon-nitrogen hydrolase family protein [Gammaproteobacteria bacterium]